MEKINLIFLFLNLLLSLGKEVTYAKAIVSERPAAVRLVNVEKGFSAQGITVQALTASDKIIFHFDLKKWGKGTLRVSDTWGKLLLEKEIKDRIISINLHDAAPGIYNITLEKEHFLEIVEIRKE